MSEFCIKVCGVTESSTAEFLIEKHISIMGLIFYPESPRFLSPEKAEVLLSQLKEKRKNIKIAGVFVNEDIERLRKAADRLKLDLIQLHGNEGPEYIDELKPYSIIKVFKMRDDLKAEEINKFTNSNIKYFLMDTYKAGVAGGTGEPFNWEKFHFLKDYNNIIISGGLNEQNILQAIEIFDPAGVDLNSGVEESPGIKSREKINKILTLLNSRS